VVKGLGRCVASILRSHQTTPVGRSTLVAVSGIDGSGKGHVSAQLCRELEDRGLRVALINIDGWLTLPETRFSQANPAEHFYLHAIRFDELFEQLVRPLRDHRSVHVEVDFTEETASQYRKRLYEFEDVDIILLEGIYLLKTGLQRHYDLSFWIDCSFETALERAVARAQEGLSPELTVAAYRTIYFLAQEIHFARDNPRAAASAIIENDSKRLRTSSLRLSHPKTGRTVLPATSPPRTA
jgi:uridine kinase